MLSSSHCFDLNQGTCHRKDRSRQNVIDAPTRRACGLPDGLLSLGRIGTLECDDLDGERTWLWSGPKGAFETLNSAMANTGEAVVVAGLIGRVYSPSFEPNATETLASGSISDLAENGFVR
jgi:hypothetical protein